MRFFFVAAVAVLALVAVAEASPDLSSHRKLVEVARARHAELRAILGQHRDRARALAEGDPDGSFDFDFDFDGGASNDADGGNGGQQLPGCLQYFFNQTAYAECAEECTERAAGYSDFANDECVADQLRNSNGSVPDFDNFFPDVDNIVNATQGNEQFQQFCTCGKSTFRFIQFYFTRVLSCVFGQRFPGVGEALAQFDTAMDALAGYMCIKNGDDYCLVTMALQEDFADVKDSDDFTFNNLTREEQCNFFEDMGCCGPSMVRALRNPRLTQLFSEDDSDSDGNEPDFDDDKETEREYLQNIADFEAGLTACGYGAVRPCLGPGEADEFAVATARLQADFSVLAANQTKLRAFRKAFREDVAGALGIPVPEVVINDVREGSVVVDFSVRGADKKNKLDAALATGVPLTNVKAMVPEYSAVSDMSASDTNITKETVTNDSDVSPASGAVPSLVALVLLAVLALFQ